MKKLLFIPFLFVLFSCAGDGMGQLQQWMRPNGKVKVLCTIAMIEDIVQQVGGERVDTITLVTGNLDPHTYQLVKGDDEKLAYAQIIFSNGLGLEHGPSLRDYMQSNPKAIRLGDRVMDADPSLVLHYNGTLDPHIWMDISLWEKIVPYIVEALIQIDPKNEKVYQENGKRLQEKMQRTHRDVKGVLRGIPDEKRYLVTSHDAFNYFARAYLASDEEDTQEEWQDRFAAPEGLAPESQLSTTDIQMIIDHLKKFDIRVLFPETNVSKDSIRKIVDAGRENGMELSIAKVYLYGDAMGVAGSSGDTYLKMIKHNANAIANYINGKYD